MGLGKGGMEEHAHNFIFIRKGFKSPAKTFSGRAAVTAFSGLYLEFSGLNAIAAALSRSYSGL